MSRKIPPGLNVILFSLRKTYKGCLILTHTCLSVWQRKFGQSLIKLINSMIYLLKNDELFGESDLNKGTL